MIQNPTLIRLVLVALLVAITVPLGACGRRGSLEEPEGGMYPRPYPADYNKNQDDTDKKK